MNQFAFPRKKQLFLNMRKLRKETKRKEEKRNIKKTLDASENHRMKNFLTFDDRISNLMKLLLGKK